MIRKITFTLLLFCCLPAGAEEFLSVQVKETKLRAAPKHWSAAVANLKYGDQILKVDEKKGWIEAVTSANKKGFVQASSVSNKKIVLSSVALASRETGSDEVILAGKGFSRTTEQEFARNFSSANFPAVDRLEKIKVNEGELLSFAKQGSLAGGSN